MTEAIKNIDDLDRNIILALQDDARRPLIKILPESSKFPKVRLKIALRV